jgi:hypothetical protein
MPEEQGGERERRKRQKYLGILPFLEFFHPASDNFPFTHPQNPSITKLNTTITLPYPILK